MMMDALTQALLGNRQVVIVTPSADKAGAKPFLEVLNKVHAPDIARAVVTSSTDRQALSSRVPWTQAKVAKDGVTTAYVCRDSVCKRPTSDLKLFRVQLLTP